MEDTGEEFLVRIIKVEEEHLENNRQESTENVNQTDFVAGSSAVNNVEPGASSSSSISLSVLEQLKATSDETASTAENSEKEAKPFSGTGPSLSSSHPRSSRDGIPLSTKSGGDMTDPEFRDFAVNSLTTLVDLAKTLSEKVSLSSQPVPVNSTSQSVPVNAASQVDPDRVDKAMNPLPDDWDISDEDMEKSDQDSEVADQSDSKGSSDDDDAYTDVSEESEDDTVLSKRQTRPAMSQSRKRRKLLKQPDLSAFSGRVCSYTLPNTIGVTPDLPQYLNANIPDVLEILEEELYQKKCIRVVLLFECEMKKAIESEDYISSIYKTNPTTMYRNSDIQHMLVEMYEEIIREFTEKLPKGSGWTLMRTVELVVRVAKFSPLKGGTYIETPTFIENSRSVVNVRNKDNKCFEYAILTPLLKPCSGYRVNKYKELEHNVNFKGLPMPMHVECISKFEQLNPTYSVNVYEIGGDESIHPVRVTKNEKENHRDLLLLHSEDGRNNHYCYINNLSRLVCRQMNKTNQSVHICKKCLATFYQNGKDRLEEHKPLCNANIRTAIELSKQKNDEKECKFRSFTNSYKVPFVVYAEILSFDDDSGKSEPLSVACYVHTHLDKQHCGKVALGYKLFEGEDCIKQFVSHVENVTENIDKIYKSPKSMDGKSPEKEAELLKQTVCHICDQMFKENDETSTDYDHITGEIRGRSHVVCNLNFKLPSFVPVILQGFDTHNMIRELADGKSEVKIEAYNSENYISIQKKIGDIYVRFLDSRNFMGEELVNLVKILPTDQCTITEKEFQGHNISLLKMNPIFYMKFFNLDEMKPADNMFTSVHLIGGVLSKLGMSKAEFKGVCKVWREFNITNNKEFCNHYMKTMVTFLADVFEHFRDICMKTFRLDPCNYHSMQDLTFEGSLRYSQVELKLPKDREMFDMIEAGIRGNFVQVVTRYVKTNNEHCEDFERKQPTSHLAFFKANHIYATQMLEPLPVGDFKFENPEKFNSESIMKIPDDGEFGYIFEVSLKYPQKLHIPHSDHPLCQTLQSPPNKKVKVLMGTLYDKENYVVHFRVLKQALQSGLVLKKVHRVLKFKQSKWLKPYIENITLLRQEASDEFSKRFYESALNSIHGKFLEDVRDKKLFTIVHTADQLQTELNKYNFLDFHIYSEKCVAVIQDHPQVIVYHPVYVGMVILDLVKMQMNHFFYDVMKKQFGKRVKCCYTDTDLFILSIESPDVDAELYKIKQHFDFSNYPPGHLLHSETNKDKLGTFKNLSATNPILEFVGLRDKCFAIKQLDPGDSNMEESDSD